MFSAHQQPELISGSTATPTCSKCGREIPRDDVNVAAAVAYCRSCNLAHALSALVQGLLIDPNVDTANPPAGAWFRDTAYGVSFGGTLRSLGSVIGALAVSLFWNGILSVFLLSALSAQATRD